MSIWYPCGCYLDAEHDAHMKRSIEQLTKDFRRWRGMDSILRLKMSVQSVKAVAGSDGEKVQEEIALLAVYGKEGSANAQWSKWTPSASLTMTINNPAAFGKVRPGQFLFVDLIPTEKDSL